MTKLRSLTQSKEFLKIIKQKKINTKYFTVYFGKNSNSLKNDLNKYLNISFVSKKKIGNAVKRNRIKRKLRAIVQKLSKISGAINLNYTYIVFGKTKSYKEGHKFLYEIMKKEFKKIKN